MTSEPFPIALSIRLALYLDAAQMAIYESTLRRYLAVGDKRSFVPAHVRADLAISLPEMSLQLFLAIPEDPEGCR
jgi:hypothetical protein